MRTAEVLSSPSYHSHSGQVGYPNRSEPRPEARLGLLLPPLLW